MCPTSKHTLLLPLNQFLVPSVEGVVYQALEEGCSIISQDVRYEHEQDWQLTGSRRFVRGLLAAVVKRKHRGAAEGACGESASLVKGYCAATCQSI